MYLHKDCSLSEQKVEGERDGIYLSGRVSTSFTPMLSSQRHFGVDDGDTGEYRFVDAIICLDCGETIAEEGWDVELYKVEHLLERGDYYENIEWKG